MDTLRLKYAYDDNTISCHERGLSHDMMKGVCVDCGWKQRADVTAALMDWAAINAGGKEWAEFECVKFETLEQVRLRVGTIHDDGFYETHYATRYYFERADGTVIYTSSGNV